MYNGIPAANPRCLSCLRLEGYTMPEHFEIGPFDLSGAIVFEQLLLDACHDVPYISSAKVLEAASEASDYNMRFYWPHGYSLHGHVWSIDDIGKALDSVCITPSCDIYTFVLPAPRAKADLVAAFDSPATLRNAKDLFSYTVIGPMTRDQCFEFKTKFQHRCLSCKYISVNFAVELANSIAQHRAQVEAPFVFNPVYYGWGSKAAMNGLIIEPDGNEYHIVLPPPSSYKDVTNQTYRP